MSDQIQMDELRKGLIEIIKKIRDKSYQMNKLRDELIKIIKKYSGANSAEKRMSMDNAKRYIEFLNGLKYENAGGEGESLRHYTVFEKIRNLIKGEQQVDKRRFTFVLGAGVSNDFGIPNWEELVYRINFSKYWQNMYGGSDSDDPATKFYNNEAYYKNLKHGLFRLNSNLYEWAQYSENNFMLDERLKESNFCMGIPSEVSEKKLDNVYYSVVKQALYYVPLYDDLNGEIKQIIDNPQGTTLGLICKIAEQEKCQRVITYNYDDFFENCWTKIGNKMPCLPIFDKQQLFENTKASNKSECKVYHVHGFIPCLSGFKEEGNEYKKIKAAAESYDGKKLILSEVSYDDIQDEIYQWRNDVQVDTLLRYSCIFVGFSATDINFKRIVKQITKIKKGKAIEESPEHFITICLDDYIRSFYYYDDSEKQRIKDVKDFIKKLGSKADEFYPYIISMLEMLMDRNNYLVRYGIYPLFTTISDLPVLLNEIS